MRPRLRGSSLFPTIRSRLLALLTVAAVPIFGMAASIAVQNRAILIERAQHRTALLLATATTRQFAHAADIERGMRGIATRLGNAVVTDDCPGHLAELASLALPQASYVALWRGLGDRPCLAEDRTSAIEPSAAMVAAASSQAGSPGALGWRVAASLSDGREPTLVAVMPLSRVPGLSAGVSALVAGLPAVWPAASRSRRLVADGDTWLVDQEGQLVPLSLSGDPASAEPRPEHLNTVLARQGGDTIAVARSGKPYAYAIADLFGGLRLLVGVPATNDLLRADSALRWRLVELGLLLLIGLLGIAVGADIVVSRPIKRLSAAVLVWRGGGPFEPEPTHDAPDEVMDLAQIFGEATKALRAREAELREVSRRQELLMQEIHHRVKNNLQIVASLLNLQASRIRQPEARAEFQAARDRIRALATLHRHLYAHGEVHTINMRAFLNELCGQLLQAIGETPAGGRIQLNIQAPELQITSDRAVPLALIVTEAVSNAAKYAFPDGRSGHITVQVDPIEAANGADPDTVRLLIQDDGIGVPAGQAETEAGVRDGLGIQLIQGFARQLGATLNVTYDDGTRYDLTVPLHAHRPEPESLERVSEPA